MRDVDPFPVASPPPPPPPSGDPWAPQGPRPTDGFAVASLVTGVLGLGAVPLALGIVALQRVRRSGAAGHGMAVAGVALGAVGLLAGLVLAVAFAVGAVAGVTEILRSSSSAGAPADASSRVLIEDLAAGDCLDYGDPHDSDAVQAVDCGDEHEAEVVDVVALPDPGAYPGDDAVDAAADTRCSGVVAAALDAAGVDGTALDYTYFTPLQAGWDDGARDVQCLVTGLDADLTGSLADGTLDVPPAPTATV